MVMYNNNSNTTNTANAYVNTNSSIKSDASSNTADMLAQMKMITSYFATFDGTPETASRFPEAFAKAFDPDVVIEVSGDGDDLTYDTALELIKAACEKGFYADLFDIVDNGDGTATMTINDHIPDIPDGPKDVLTRQIVYFKNGKVIRIHAVDPDADQYGRMVARCQRYMSTSTASPNAVMACKYANMLACFDGSPDAYAKALPIIDEIFDSGLVVDVGSGQSMDFEGFQGFAAAFAKQRNLAKLENIYSTDDGFHVVIRNVVGGVDQGPCPQLGLVKNGKIVRWSAKSKDEDAVGLDKLVASVAANQEGMIGNIQRVRDYLGALDGSPDAFERFESHIDRVHARDVVWESGDGAKMNYDEIVALIRDKYIPNGCYPVLESVEVGNDGRSLIVVINNHLPGEEGDATRQVLYYGDDDRIHRLTSAPFYSTCERIAALPKKNTKE